MTCSVFLAVLMAVGAVAHASPQAARPSAPPARAMGARPAAPAVTPVDAAEPAHQVPVPRASVAAVMSGPGQALLWDHVDAQYVVVRSGDAFQGFTVTSVGPDQVVLSRNNQHFVLPRTSDTLDLDSRRRPRPDDGVAQRGQDTALVDPYAPGGAPGAPMPAVPDPGRAAGAAPVDPYASHAAPGPAAPAGSAVRIEGLGAPAKVLEPPAPAAPVRGLGAPAKVLEPVAPVARRAPAGRRPRVTAMPSPVVRAQAEARQVREERYRLERREIDAAMADFETLGEQVQVELEPAGVHLVSVAAGSLPHRLGLRAGDVILSVDGQRIASLDDAAGIYARLMGARQTVVMVKRGERLIRMRYRFA